MRNVALHAAKETEEAALRKANAEEAQAHVNTAMKVSALHLHARASGQTASKAAMSCPDLASGACRTMASSLWILGRMLDAGCVDEMGVHGWGSEAADWRWQPMAATLHIRRGLSAADVPLGLEQR